MIVFKWTFLIPVLAIAVLFVINAFGSARGWYGFKGNWFSRIMHFSAGFFVAMFWSFLIEGWPVVVGLTLFVGVLWEIYEYLITALAKRLNKPDWEVEREDWVEDLVMDTLGAIALVLIFII